MLRAAVHTSAPRLQDADEEHSALYLSIRFSAFTHQSTSRRHERALSGASATAACSQKRRGCRTVIVPPPAPVSPLLPSPAS